jgi:cation efflux family protein
MALRRSLGRRAPFPDLTYDNVLYHTVKGHGGSLRSVASANTLMNMGFRAFLLVPGLATLWTAWKKFHVPVAPEPAALSLAGLGALVVNVSCAFILAHYRRHSGSLTRAAFLSARNDALANMAIIVAGLLTAFLWRSAWPDLIVQMATRHARCGRPPGRNTGRCVTNAGTPCRHAAHSTAANAENTVRLFSSSIGRDWGREPAAPT